MIGRKFKQGEPEDKKVKRSLRFSILDGSFYNIMDGFTISFITPYALFLKASSFVISLLVSMPDLLASFFQLSAIKVSEVFKSKKLIIVFSAFLHALLWLPILFIPKIAPPEKQGLYLVVFVTLIAMISSFAGPLWRGLMGELVAEHERGSFFSKRNKITALVCFVSTLLAGIILQHFSVTNPFFGFTILFAVAFVTRIISAAFLLLMYEMKSIPTARFREKNVFTLRKFLVNLRSSDYGKFVLVICLFRIAVSIASPFFAVYELSTLHFSYLQFTIMTAVEIMSTFAFMGLWGKINDEKGSKIVILICGLLIPFVPLLYLVSTKYFFLMAVTILSGAAWGGFNLAVGNFMFDASNSENRIRYVAYFNLLHGISAFLGAGLGGLLLKLPMVSIPTLFLVSGLLRLAIAFFLFPALREMRIITVSFDRRLFNYSLFIKPRQGFVEDPFDYYMAYEKKTNMPRPKLYIDKQFLDDLPDEDSFEEKVKDHAKYKNFIQNLVDNMKKK